MWEKIVSIFQTAESFIRTDKAPPGTPSQYLEEAKKTTFLASKKFFVVFFSVILVAVYFGASTAVLFMTAPFPTLTGPFVTMFVEALKLLTIIIASYLGLQTTLDWKMSSSTNVDTITENTNITEKVDEKIVTKYEEIYKDDPSYAPLKWVFKNE